VFNNLYSAELDQSNREYEMKVPRLNRNRSVLINSEFINEKKHSMGIRGEDEDQADGANHEYSPSKNTTLKDFSATQQYLMGGTMNNTLNSTKNLGNTRGGHDNTLGGSSLGMGLDGTNDHH
jgi:hypothetical protein